MLFGIDPYSSTRPFLTIRTDWSTTLRRHPEEEPTLSRASIAATIVTLALSAEIAHATSPGKNGRIAFRYLGEARSELDRLRRPLMDQFVARWGAAAAGAETQFWELLATCLDTGALTSTDVKGSKP